MINLCIYVQLLLILSNHNMGCVSILTFQNVIHPQTAVFATEIPPGRSSRGSWQPGAVGKGNPSNDEHLMLGSIYKLEKFIENLLKQQKKQGRSKVSKKMLEDF